MTLCLIAFAGLSGSGKSTAIKHLVDRGVATSFYAGEFLAAELAAKGLERTPDNERELRIALRREHGMGVFADRSIPELRLRVAGGVVLLDAIYCPAEHEAYRAAFADKMAVVAMAASFERERSVLLHASTDHSTPQNSPNAIDWSSMNSRSATLSMAPNGPSTMREA